MKLLTILSWSLCIMAAQAQPPLHAVSRPELHASSTSIAPITAVETWDSAAFAQQILTNTSDTTFVVNFWATWCRPCVEELPSFVRLDSVFRFRNAKARVILVSLDFAKDLHSKLIPFLTKRSISTTTVLFADRNMNAWIDAVSPDWSGAIPATLIINPAQHRREFYEREFQFEELVQQVSSIIGE